MPRISIIVAMAKNRVIGVNNTLPWHLSADLKRFKALTMGHHIIMGRKTFESIGKILPGRRHVIISRRSDYAVSGASVVTSLSDAIARCTNDSEIFVIGGGEIFKLALPISDRILATELDAAVDGDTYFPELDVRLWRETERVAQVDERSGQRFSFVTFDRRG